MSEPFKGWAILEIMGHRQAAGFVQEVDHFGAKMARVDVPEVPAEKEGEASMGWRREPLPGVPGFTQYYGGSAVFCMTPTTEAIARAAAARYRHRPPEMPVPMARQLAGVEEELDQEVEGDDAGPEVDAEFEPSDPPEARG